MAGRGVQGRPAIRRDPHSEHRSHSAAFQDLGTNFPRLDRIVLAIHGDGGAVEVRIGAVREAGQVRQQPHFGLAVLGTDPRVSTMPAVIVGTCRTMSDGIVATKCGSCGIVGVYVNGSVIVKINLDADSTHYRQLILLPRFSRRTGTVTVKVLTSDKAMQIDGLLVNRS